MIKIARTLRMGIAAFAISAAAAATTIAPAQAAPAAPLPTVGVGSSAANDIILLPVAPGGNANAGNNNRVGIAAAPAQRFFYFGPADPNAAPKQTIFSFSPIALLPGFVQPLFGWFTQNLNFEACVGGLSAKVGPYGTFSVSIGRSC